MSAHPGSCIGQNPTCPCQDGDACHYEDTPTTKGWPVPDDQTGALRNCRDDGRCQYAIDHGAEGLGHCSPKCVMPRDQTGALRQQPEAVDHGSLSAQAIAFCDESRGKKYEGCGRCEVRAICHAAPTTNLSAATLGAWVQRMNAAVETIKESA